MSSKSPNIMLGICVGKVLHEYMGHNYVERSSSGSDHKSSLKIVTNMPCGTCFPVHGPFLHVDIDSDGHFDPMTSSNLTFDGGQAKVRSNEVIQNQSIFNSHINSHININSHQQGLP